MRGKVRIGTTTLSLPIYVKYGDTETVIGTVDVEIEAITEDLNLIGNQGQDFDEVPD